MMRFRLSPSIWMLALGALHVYGHEIVGPESPPDPEWTELLARIDRDAQIVGLGPHVETVSKEELREMYR